MYTKPVGVAVPSYLVCQHTTKVTVGEIDIISQPCCPLRDDKQWYESLQHQMLEGPVTKRH